jgi:hypothetical protein
MSVELDVSGVQIEPRWCASRALIGVGRTPCLACDDHAGTTPGPRERPTTQRANADLAPPSTTSHGAYGLCSPLPGCEVAPRGVRSRDHGGPAAPPGCEVGTTRHPAQPQGCEARTTRRPAALQGCGVASRGAQSRRGVRSRVAGCAVASRGAPRPRSARCTRERTQARPHGGAPTTPHALTPPHTAHAGCAAIPRRAQSRNTVRSRDHGVRSRVAGCAVPSRVRGPVPGCAVATVVRSPPGPRPWRPAATPRRRPAIQPRNALRRWLSRR